ncbi:MAG: DUF1203 domain-containing protein [Usitatibacter sp.]
MSFRVRGLSPDPFRRYFEMSDAELRTLGAVRVTAEDAGLPCRVSLRHAPVGDELLLLNYEHQGANTPYRASHAIYVARSSQETFDAVDVIPEVIESRLVSVRAFDERHMMIDGEVIEGAKAAALFDRMLSNGAVSYLHVHNAKRGCYSARVERA